VQLFVEVCHLGTDFFELAFDLADLCLGVVEALLNFETSGLELVDMVLERVGLAAVMQRIVVLVPGFFETALLDTQGEVVVAVRDFHLSQFGFELGHPLRGLAACQFLVRRGQRFAGFLVLGVSFEALLLVGDALLQLRLFEPEELGLMVLPWPARDIVVPHRPDRSQQ
jgi:hypothetical protein